MKVRKTVPLFDEYGHSGIQLVPLGPKQDKWCCIYRNDWEYLALLGCPLNWSISNNIVSASKADVPGRRLSVARILLNAGPNEEVRYKDFNPLNLVRENLCLVKGYALKRDRDYLSLTKA